MKSTKPKKISGKQYLVVASMIFALFFGAGNLIFPLHLGQLAGKNWLLASTGFLLTGVVLPLLSLLAIAITRSNGIYHLSLPVGSGFALIFMTLTQLTLGPLFAAPRNATVSYTVGIAPLLPKQFQDIGLIIFTIIFFVIVFAIAYNESDILSSLGKILNPIFLILLFLVFVVAFAKPLGNPSSAHVTGVYAHRALISGFLEGYNTMDALAGLAFGVTVVTSIKELVNNDELETAKVTAKSGFIAVLGIGLIYCLLIILGAMSLGHFKIAADGGVLLSEIVTYYAGIFGQALLAMLIFLACLTTAVGVVAAFALDFHSHYPKLSYHAWLAIACVGSLATANLGLVQIIKWSLPILMFLYPIAIVLIVLALLSPFFKNDHVVYKVAIFLTLIPAVFDLIVNLPAPLANTNFVKAVANWRMTCLPLANVGLSWLVPTLIGLVLGIVLHIWRRKKEKI
ncbi:branched-chain amino acid transport system II carrier protein [Lactobacillus hominis]|uniref:branched-chain amino acid transport system II carrier protein n=1 Tax=Lactobacillus hominis TaxID=1203033 RepID=UPI00261B1211|nr:branched-chain amino acid transport system II carrier protein [Lactobacillus hominis]